MTEIDNEEDNLPPFSALRGLAPNATHGLAAEDFVAFIRSGRMLGETPAETAQMWEDYQREEGCYDQTHHHYAECYSL